MRNQWYADKSDLVKWGGIIHLCNKTKITNVMQVAYFRECSKKSQLYFEKEDIPIPDKVIEHFRDIEDIKRLSKKVRLNIDVIKKPFNQKGREDYNKFICQRIQKQPQPKIVFLDPDTGLAPQKAKEKHVKPDEVLSIWCSLKPGDYLVFYQHNTHKSNWRKLQKVEFAKACKVKESIVNEWRASENAKDLAQDVVFFSVRNKF